MSDQQMPARIQGAEDSASPFDELIGGAAASRRRSSSAPFTTAFRGYDRDEVDAAIARLTARLRADGNKIDFLEKRYRRVSEAANSHSREAVEQLEAEYDAKLQAAEARGPRGRGSDDGGARRGRTRAPRRPSSSVQAEVDAAGAQTREDVERLEGELATATARAATAEQRIQTLTEELVDGGVEAGNRPQFEEILRVAEDQANLIIRNASVQADRLLEAAREEIVNRRKEVQVEAESILAAGAATTPSRRGCASTPSSPRIRRSSSARPRTRPRRSRRPSRRRRPSAARPRRALRRCARWSHARPRSPAPRPRRPCASCGCAHSSSRSR